MNIPPANTRHRREERQNLDDGDPEDTVYRLPPSNQYDSGGWDTPKRHGRVYHEDEDCQYIRRYEDSLDDTREDAQEIGLAPCAVCILGKDYADNAGAGATCPFCGDDVSRLPNHLPCPEQP